MRTYVFETSATMKEYNCKNYWIMNDIVGKFETEADSLTDALESFKDYVWNVCCISISDNAMKTKSPMMETTRTGEEIQVGYVITGLLDFQSDSGKWSKQYINLCVKIRRIENIDFAAA